MFLEKPIYKQRGFNFLLLARERLRQKANVQGFLEYRTVYLVCGQLFCFPKDVTKNCLREMKKEGLIKFCKRGIFVL